MIDTSRKVIPLSSDFTPAYRWWIPGALTLGALIVLWQIGGVGRSEPIHQPSLALALAIAATMFIYARLLDGAKKVSIGDGQLCISDYRHKQRIAAADIQATRVEPFMWPTRVRVVFSNATRFGLSIVFFPPGAPFSRASGTSACEKILSLSEAPKP